MVSCRVICGGNPVDPLISVLLNVIADGLWTLIEQTAVKASRYFATRKLTSATDLLPLAKSGIPENLKWPDSSSLPQVLSFLKSPEVESCIREVFAINLNAGDEQPS